MKVNNTDALFDEHGRRLPFQGMRVFNNVSRRYYRLNQPDVQFDTVLGRIREHAEVDTVIPSKTFESVCLDLKQMVRDRASIKNIFNGVHVPFVCPKVSNEMDLGKEFEEHWLAAVDSSFTKAFPHYHFKATVQDDLSLNAKLRFAERSRYEHLLRARRRGAVVGWYFPSALQEYDIASQRSQIETLPLPETLVLSGGFEVAAALVGSPDLLMNKEAYPPVLCLSAFQHADERLMLCFKAYGQGLEFWCMSHMLTLTTTQVSEQWTGGLTLFTVVS